MIILSSFRFCYQSLHAGRPYLLVRAIGSVYKHLFGRTGADEKLWYSRAIRGGVKDEDVTIGCLGGGVPAFIMKLKNY